MLKTLRQLSKAARLLSPVGLVRRLDRVDQLEHATRELTATVDALRVSTLQLLAIEQNDWQRHEDVQQFEARLEPDRVRAHVTRAIERATIQEHPFPHMVVDKWLPHDVYRRMIDALPPPVFFADRDQSRQRLAVPFHVAPAYSRRVWQFIANDVVTGMVGPALTDRLGSTIREYLRNYCGDLPADIDLTLHASNGRIMLRRPGYVIQPHRDPRWGFVTCLVYLAKPGDDEAHGTQLYAVRDDGEAPSDKPFYVEESRCDLVKSVPFRANTMLVFLNSHGAHGASIPSNAIPATLERYLYQFRLGPTNSAMTELLDCMPKDKRGAWEGAKTGRAEDRAGKYD